MNELDQDLPDELLDQHAAQGEARLAKIASLSMIVSSKRDDAVAGRANSGIEEEWTEDTEACEGVDDANRADQKFVKPSSTSGGLTRSRPVHGTRSTVFLNITRPYIDSAAARIGDMLLPTDDRNWQIKAEPMPELTSVSKGKFTKEQEEKLRNWKQQQQPQPQQPGQPAPPPPPEKTLLVKAMEEAQALLDAASDSAKRAETRIDDWLTESQFHAECRKIIDDACRIGVGVLKGPYPTKVKSKVVHKTEEGIALEIAMKLKPSSKRIDPWNCYPDPSCGDNIHNGNYFIEHDSITERQLRELSGTPGYIEQQIKECIKEGPQAKYAGGGNPTQKERSDKELYDIWYYYGSISSDELIAAGVEDVKEGDESKYAVISLVNDRVIKAALNPLDSGEFPYDVIPYQRRSGTWAGIGVSRQVRTPQGMINAGTRNMMDNAAISGGPIYAIDRQMLEPITGGWDITPRKGFYTTAEAEGKDIRQAFTVFNIPSQQKELMAIIQFALKMAEDVTGMPMLLQGQTGAAPDTLGGQLLANNNASAVLRRFARLWDDCITEPHIRRYYEFLLMYGEDEEEKGQYTIDARGSSALVERDIQNHAAMQVLQFSANPIFGIDPKKAAQEALKAQRLDPRKFVYTEEEQAKMEGQQQTPAPQVQAAQIRAETELKKVQMKGQIDGQMAHFAAQDDLKLLQTKLQVEGQLAHFEAQDDLKLAQFEAQTRLGIAKVDTDRDTEFVLSQERRDATAHEGRMAELQVKRELALLEYANRKEISLEQVKAQLAQTAMAETTKRQLAQAQIALNQAENNKDRAVDVHKHGVDKRVDIHKHKTQLAAAKPPEPLEPAGRAPNGQSFAK